MALKVFIFLNNFGAGWIFPSKQEWLNYGPRAASGLPTSLIQQPTK